MAHWLDPAKYEHIPITGGTGPGTYVEGTAWKFVLHSTEGPPGSIAGTVRLFESRPLSCPHLMIDPMGTGRRIQHIPLDWSACALRGGRGGWQTNRARAIQMEVVGYTNDSPGWPDGALATIADVIADVCRAGFPINPHNVPDDSGLHGTLATEGAPQRFSGEAFALFDGICGHVRVPFQDHYDIAYLNTLRVAELVRANLDGRPGPVAPPAGRPAGGGPSGGHPGYLSRGSAGGQVTFVQDLLRGLGFDPGPSDGDFGPATEAAVKRFQASRGLSADGIVGPATNAAISEAYSSTLPPGQPPLPAPPAPGSTPAWPGRFLVHRAPAMSGGDVGAWQARMAERRWPITVDSIYGPGSAGTCTAFQREKGLSVDGVVGQQTWDAAWTAPVT